MCRTRAQAGDTSQTSAAIARKESWQPTSKRYIGLMPRVNRPASDSVLAGRARRWAMAAEQNVVVMTVERTTEGASPTSKA